MAKPCETEAQCLSNKCPECVPTYEFECPRCGHCCQQREWVGLTDEEINIVGKDAWDCWHYYDETFTEIYRLLEAKLKEKNT